MFIFLGGERGNQFFSSPYLNYNVFVLNPVSVLNDVGMFVVCGVLKKFSFSSLKHRFLVNASHAVTPAPKPEYEPSD